MYLEGERGKGGRERDKRKKGGEGKEEGMERRDKGGEKEGKIIVMSRRKRMWEGKIKEKRTHVFIKFTINRYLIRQWRAQTVKTHSHRRSIYATRTPDAELTH